jgi:hypothetical protein
MAASEATIHLSMPSDSKLELSLSMVGLIYLMVVDLFWPKSRTLRCRLTAQGKYDTGLLFTADY